MKQSHHQLHVWMCLALFVLGVNGFAVANADAESQHQRRTDTRVVSGKAKVKSAKAKDGSGTTKEASTKGKRKSGETLEPDRIIAGKLSPSNKYYKYGKTSYRWDFKANEALQLTFDGQIPKLNNFMFWAYSESPQDGKLKLALNNSKANVRPIGLNFKNWRGFLVRFDASPDANTASKQVAITAPNNAGTLWLDGFRFITSAGIEGDSNIPYNLEHGQFNGSWYFRSTFPKPKPLASVSPKVQKAFAGMRDRYLEVYASYSKTKPYLKHPDLDETHAYYKRLLKEYDVKRIDGRIEGAPINGKGPLVGYVQLLLWHAQRWRWDHDREAGQKALLIYDHFVEQGYCDDSSRGYVPHDLWHLRVMGPALVLLRPLLIETGRLDDVIKDQVWLSTLERIFSPLQPGSRHNSYYTSIEMMLGALMLMRDDDPMKEVYIRRYLEWRNAKAIPTILSGVRNPDFTQDFHSRHSSGYYVGDMRNLAKCIYTLQCPEFRVPENVLHDLKMKYLISDFTHCNTSPSMTQGNRIPFSELWSLKGRLQGSTSKSKFDQLNLYPSSNHGNAYVLGLVKFGDETQEEIQGAVCRWAKDLSPEMFNMEALKQYANARPSPSPNGFLPLPYSNVSNFRRNDWMVSLGGYNKYVPAAEFSNGSADYARYFYNGSMWIQAQGSPEVSMTGSGYEVSGFDYNHVPGTTAIVLPADQLRTKIPHIYGKETFSGGVHLNGQQGVFSTIISDNPDPTFQARKSFFCFGNRIVCVGTGIFNENNNPTHTTLFQVNLSQGDPSEFFDGQRINQLPYHTTRTSNGPLVLIDPKDNGFYVYPDQHVVLRRNQNQVLRAPKGTDLKGNTSTAYIDHGSAPEDASYRYVAFVRTGPEKMERFKNAMAGNDKPLEIVEQSNDAHVVLDNENRFAGYVAFKGKTFAKGIVKAIDTPSIVILQHKDPSRMLMSIGNPDLDLKEKPNPTQYDRYIPNTTKISVILDGIWKGELNENLEDPWQFGGTPVWSVNHNQSEGRTTVSYDARLGRSLNLLLQKH